MGEVIQFDIGCRKCKYLMQMEKGTFTCTELDNAETGENLYPIVDGQHTKDWGACNGEYREVDINKMRLRGRRRSS